MTKSMTGYGRAEASGRGWAAVFEAKSVNSRYLDVRWRLPGRLRSLEQEFERVLRANASRGRVEIHLGLDIQDPALAAVRMNRVQASAMLDELDKLAHDRGQVFNPDYTRLLGVPPLWQEESSEVPEDLAEGLKKCLKDALDAWNEARLAEGEHTAEDMRSRLAVITDLAGRISERLPVVLEAKRQSLRERIAQFLEQSGAEVNEDRLLMEVAALTDRIDVSEEMTRLEAHLKRLGETLNGNSEQGKRLDFLLQETFREINTCGNKCQDADISALVVEFKVELEKCREQAQNIE